MLALLDYCDAQVNGTPLFPGKSNRRVVGVDIDIRAHNRQEIEAHPLSHLITLIQGSSIAPDIVDQVRQAVGDAKRVLVLSLIHIYNVTLARLCEYPRCIAVAQAQFQQRIGMLEALNDPGAELVPTQDH